MSAAGPSSDTSGTRGADLGTTYFSYTGPTTLDTSFTNHATTDNNNDRNTRRDGTLRELESLHSSPSEPADNDVSTIPLRPRPFRDPHSLVLIAPPYPAPGYPGYLPLAPPLAPYDPMLRSPSDESFQRRQRRNPYENLQTMKMRHLVIFMAFMFIIAFIAAIFCAVYFGHKIDARSNS